MPEMFRLGPLALPVPVLILLLAFLLASWAGRRLSRGHGEDFDGIALWVLVQAMIAARLAFVAVHFDSYRDAIWTVLDIRDGGWYPLAGLITVAVAAALAARRRVLLRRPLLVATLLGSGIWLLGQVGLAAGRLGDQPLPALPVATINGDPITLDRFKGQPVVINLWATWCPPCRREMPVLERAQHDHPGIRFILLNQGEDGGVVRQYLTRESLRFEHVWLDAQRSLARHFGLGALPTTLFFDREGRLSAVRTGELSSATLAQRLRALH